MTKEQRREYNKAYREAHKEYFQQKAKEYRDKTRAKYRAMEAEIAELKEKEAFRGRIMGWALMGEKIEFATSEEV